MHEGVIDFGIGALGGGLVMSASWGLFWLAIGTVGYMRGTCGWRVMVNSAMVLTMPLLIGLILLWARGAEPRPGLAFGTGLLVMPVVLAGLAWREAPDGRRAGRHMLAGVRRLMGDLLGQHHLCGGCAHEHDHGETS